MPDQQLVDDYERLLAAYRDAAEQLVRVLEPLAIGTLRDVLPGTQRLDVEGGLNEDGAATLRIRRIRDAEGVVLFDVALGHDDPRVEDAVDEVGVEYLDLLLELTGDEYFGPNEIEGG